MIMKMHSYITTNGQLKTAADQSQALLRKLKAATIAAGGWDKAILAAKAHRAQFDESSGLGNSSDVSTPEASVEGSNISFVDAPTAAALRKRLVAVSLDSSSDNNFTTSSEAGFAIHPLVDHPDAEISTLAKDLSEIQSELSSSGPNPVQWPDNITLKNFAVYQLIPTLVYELEYPRTDRFVTYARVNSFPDY
jgi:sterol O-acyltransferase